MAFLDDDLTKQVTGVLAALENDVELVVYTGTALEVPGRDPVGEQKATLELLKEVAATSDKVTVIEKNLILDDDAAALGITLAPTTLFRRKGEDRTNMRFVGLPSGYEFSTLLETILMVGASQAPTGVELDSVADIDASLRLRTFVTPTCPHCPRSVITSFRFALVNPNIVAEGIEANEFPTLSSGYRISGVPDTIVEGKPGSGVKATRVLGAQPEAAFVGALRQALGAPQPGAATD